MKLLEIMRSSLTGGADMADLRELELYTLSLDEEDIDDLVMAIDDITTQKLRFAADIDLDEEIAINNLDDILANAPRTKEPMTLFKRFIGLPELRKGGKLSDAGYTTGTTKDVYGGTEKGSSESVPLAIEVPKGTRVIYLGEDNWILPRGLNFLLRAAETGPVPTRIL